MLSLEKSKAGCTVRIKVQPNARRTDFAGLHGEALRIALRAPAVDGKANKALVEFLADALAVSRSSVEIVAGEKSREKTIHLLGVEPATLLATLEARGVLPPTESNGTDNA